MIRATPNTDPCSLAWAMAFDEHILDARCALERATDDRVSAEQAEAEAERAVQYWEVAALKHLFNLESPR